MAIAYIEYHGIILYNIAILTCEYLLEYTRVPGNMLPVWGMDSFLSFSFAWLAWASRQSASPIHRLRYTCTTPVHVYRYNGTHVYPVQNARTYVYIVYSKYCTGGEVSQQSYG